MDAPVQNVVKLCGFGKGIYASFGSDPCKNRSARHVLISENVQLGASSGVIVRFLCDEHIILYQHLFRTDTHATICPRRYFRDGGTYGDDHYNTSRNPKSEKIMREKLCLNQLASPS